MSAPKLTRILEVIASRLEVVDQAAGYYSDIGTDVRLDRRPPDVSTLPCVLVYLEPAEVDRVTGNREQVALSITVEAFAHLKPGGHFEGQGVELLSDIQKAVELADDTLGGLVSGANQGIRPASFETALPEQGVNAVSARITYAVPYIRKSGDPEIV